MREWNACASLHQRLPVLSMSDRLRISHVCHYWRLLAISAQRMWCRLDVWWRQLNIDTRMTNSPPLHNLDALSCLLPRSRDLPLVLHFCSPVSEPSVDIGSDLGALLAPHQARLVAIHARVDSPYVLENFLLRLERLPWLEVFSADGATPACLDLPIDLALCRLALPRLRHLELRHWNFDLIPMHDILPSFPSVTDLECRITTARGLHNILAAFPSLTRATLQGLADDFAGNMSHIQRLANCIQDLTICDVPEYQEDRFLEIFSGARDRQAFTFRMLMWQWVTAQSLAIIHDFREGCLHMRCTTGPHGIEIDVRDEVSGLRRIASFHRAVGENDPAGERGHAHGRGAAVGMYQP